MGQMNEDVIRKAAEILGPHSAAAKAIRDAERRRLAGEEVRFFKHRGSLIVVNASFIEGTPAADDRRLVELTSAAKPRACRYDWSLAHRRPTL